MATKPRAPTMTPIMSAMFDPPEGFALSTGVLASGGGGGVPGGVLPPEGGGGGGGATLSPRAVTLNCMREPSDLPVN
jgi:hypothetical protein